MITTKEIAWLAGLPLYSLMSERRKKRIRGLLDIWKSAKIQFKSTLKCEHIEDWRKNRTVCQKCYSHDWYLRNKKGGQEGVYTVASSTI